MIICCSNAKNVLYRVLRGISEEYLKAQRFHQKYFCPPAMRRGCTDVGTCAVCPPRSAPGDRPWPPGFRWVGSPGQLRPYGFLCSRRAPVRDQVCGAWRQGVGLEGGYCAISFLFLDPALVFVNSPFVKPAPKYYFEGPGP